MTGLYERPRLRHGVLEGYVRFINGIEVGAGGSITPEEGESIPLIRRRFAASLEITGTQVTRIRSREGIIFRVDAKSDFKEKPLDLSAFEETPHRRRKAGVPITVFLSGPFEVMNEGLGMLLEKKGFEVAGRSTVWNGSLDTSIKPPDVVVVDTAIPDIDWHTSTKALKKTHPTTKVVTFGEDFHPRQIALFRKAGIRYAVLKTDPILDLTNTIIAASQGAFYRSNGVSPLFDLAFEAWNSVEDLTRREIQVLKLLATGHTNQQVADQLQISVKTAEAHRANILAKTYSEKRADLVQLAAAYQ